MGKIIFSSTRVIMKTFAAALFAAGVAASTYSVAGTTGTGMTSSKVSTTLAVVSTKLTQTQQIVGTALGTATHYFASALCTTREASKFICSLCEVTYSDGTNYTASYSNYTPTAALTLASATTELSSLTNIGSLNGTKKTSAAVAHGTAATLTTDATNMVLNSIKLSTDKTTLDCTATYTDPTVNTTAREDVVKTAMATAQQAISNKTAAVVSVLATAKMVAGSLSTVASVGAAIAALSMSF